MSESLRWTKIATACERKTRIIFQSCDGGGPQKSIIDRVNKLNVELKHEEKEKKFSGVKSIQFQPRRGLFSPSLKSVISMNFN